MRTSRRPFAGRTDAIGFLLDPAHVDPADLVGRVAALWTPGASLHLVGDRLLVLRRTPVSVRSELALGLPVEGTVATVEIHDGGSVSSLPVGSLAPVDPAEVVDISSLTIEVLEAAPAAPAPPPEPMTTAPPPRSSFRKAAGVREADVLTRRHIEKLAATTARGAPSWQRVLGRTSPGPLLGRRNARYVERLTRSFKDKDWDRALSTAIGLGGLGARGWALRLPNRGRVTGPGRPRLGAGPSHDFSASLQAHLRDLYTQAAEQLEAEGEILLAAFVQADLLNNPVAAVELVERHGDLRKAAELAEGWIKEPAISVRLWWRAGDRDRAIAVARSRGAFADAVSRLQKVDAAAAAELRAEWVVELQAAGNHLGAVRAAWPVAELRDRVVADLGAAVGGGGRDAGIALAYLIEYRSNLSALEAVRALLREPGAARDAFLDEFPARRAAEPTADREIATLCLLALVHDVGNLSRQALARTINQLSPRADPLVVADLPGMARPAGPAAHDFEHDLTEQTGVTVFDAVAVSETGLLIALGERGARLVGPDGRIRAEWSVPAYWIVAADHGRRVLLVTPRGDRYVVHELDLPNGRPRLLPPLTAAPVMSYDGIRPVVVTDHGIEWLEETQGRWRVVWRELTQGELIHDVQRTAASMSVAFTDVHQHRIWQWELPAIVLRQSGAPVLDPSTVLSASGRFGTLEQGRGVAKVSWFSMQGHRINTSDHYTDGDATLIASGEANALHFASGATRRMLVFNGWEVGELARLRLPMEPRPILRSAGGLITVGHSAGRIVAIHPETRRTVIDVTLQL